jgi:hypothetical protein
MPTENRGDAKRIAGVDRQVAKRNISRGAFDDARSRSAQTAIGQRWHVTGIGRS